MFILSQKRYANNAWKPSHFTPLLCSRPFCSFITPLMFFCFVFSSLLISLCHHYFCHQRFDSFLLPFCTFFCSFFCSLSEYPILFFTFTSPILSTQPFHHLRFTYLSPIKLPPPSLLHHSIFVLVLLQKWDSAVTNLLAKPPRAPCGGASSQRTHVIDWT